MRLKLQPFVALAVLSMMAAPFVAWSAEASSLTRFRLAVSANTVEGVNENDARAAMKIWGDTVAQGMGLEGVYDSKILTRPDDVYQAAREGKLDALAITAAEYPQVAAYVDHGLVIGNEALVRDGDAYLLIVDAETGIRNLSDLKGRSLVMGRGAHMCLARAWLETLLARAGLGKVEECFGHVSTDMKPSMAVLPVFFHRADVGLVNRRAFDAMTEMNPQIGKQLRVLASSPRTIDTIVLFHKNCPPQLKDRLKAMLLSVHDTPAGQQILALFQTRRLAATDVSILRGTLEILAAHDRVRGAKASTE